VLDIKKPGLHERNEKGAKRRRRESRKGKRPGEVIMEMDGSFYVGGVGTRKGAHAKRGEA